MRPAPASARALTEAARGGARAALVCSGGYAEAGIAGAAFQRDLAAAAAEAGVALLGPNTSGFLVPARRLHASFVPGAASVPAGPVAVVAASGGVNHALAYLLAEAGLGVRSRSGWATRSTCPHRTCCATWPTIADPRRGPARGVGPGRPGTGVRLRYLTARKPVAVLVVGRSDVADFAQSHTGALATTWRVTRAALRQAGAVLVDDELELADAVAALSALRLPPAAMPTVGVVSAQAGPALLHVDGLRARGILVPELTAATQQRLASLLPPLTYQANPVDTGRPGPRSPRCSARSPPTRASAWSVCTRWPSRTLSTCPVRLPS